MESAVPGRETYNPWTVVNVVFQHLADEGLHPVLGVAGNPAEPAAALLRTFGIHPDPQGNEQVVRDKDARLAELRRAMFGNP